MQRFFKTGKGEYGEGDVFLGVTVPVQRQVARRFQDLPLAEAARLLKSSVHEERLTALFILVAAFKNAGAAVRKKIFGLYLKNARRINNWDLVDSSAPNVVGAYLIDKPRAVLYRLAQSPNLWERRIAMLATYAFIRRNDFQATLTIAKMQLQDKHDLMHKAVGWMLREVGNRDRAAEEAFLQRHYRTMPCTMLRYAVEKFDERTRKAYLAGTR